MLWSTTPQHLRFSSDLFKGHAAITRPNEAFFFSFGSNAPKTRFFPSVLFPSLRPSVRRCADQSCNLFCGVRGLPQVCKQSGPWIELSAVAKWSTPRWFAFFFPRPPGIRPAYIQINQRLIRLWHGA